MQTGSPEDATRPSLLLRLRDTSDSEAWRTFVETYAPPVYAYGRKLGLQDADAADVAQDVLAQMVRSMRGFEYDRERGRFRDWLRTVTRNRVLKFLAKKDREGALPLDPEMERAADLADAQWPDEFGAQVLRIALERIRPIFEPATWSVFEQVWLRRQSPLDASRNLGLAIDLVYSAKSRVLKRLREEVLMLAEDLPQCVPLND